MDMGHGDPWRGHPLQLLKEVGWPQVKTAIGTYQGALQITCRQALSNEHRFASGRGRFEIRQGTGIGSVELR